MRFPNEKAGKQLPAFNFALPHCPDWLMLWLSALGFLGLNDFLNCVKQLEPVAHSWFFRVRLHPLTQNLLGGFDLLQSIGIQHLVVHSLAGQIEFAVHEFTLLNTAVF